MYEKPDWHGNQMFLFTQTGYNLTIRSNGDVLGSDNDDLESRLEISSAGDVSLVRIKGLESGLYLCFDLNGKLYGESDPDVDGTVFREEFQGSYSAYKSVAFPDWYVGIKKSGCAKPGPKTRWGQKAVKFLPRRRNFS